MKNLKVSLLTLLESSWRPILADQFEQAYMQALFAFLNSEMTRGKVIYPPMEQWFNAFLHTPFDKVKVVILGQDPYHGAGQAHGLSFSVPEGVAIPPSLANIFKELHRDLGVPLPTQGNLLAWADQGVLLLNATLTVEANRAGSHQNRGWEHFTDTIISCLNDQREGIVFLLWGAFAHKKAALIDDRKHCILTTSHPSPLAAYRGFLGSGQFSEANQYLVSQGKKAIDWSLKSAHAAGEQLSLC